MSGFLLFTARTLTLLAELLIALICSGASNVRVLAVNSRQHSVDIAVHNVLSTVTTLEQTTRRVLRLVLMIIIVREDLIPHTPNWPVCLRSCIEKALPILARTSAYSNTTTLVDTIQVSVSLLRRRFVHAVNVKRIVVVRHVVVIYIRHFVTHKRGRTLNGISGCVMQIGHSFCTGLQAKHVSA